MIYNPDMRSQRKRRKSPSRGRNHDDEITSAEVHGLCDQVRNSFLDETKEYAREKVLSSVATAYEDLCKEDEIRLRYLERIGKGAPVENTSVSARTDAASGADKSLESLEQIIADAGPPGTKRERKAPVTPIEIPPTTKMPKYDAWVPVRTNFRLVVQLELQPYMPFLGDKESQLKKAFEVEKEMELDASKGEDISDGSIDSDGDFVEKNFQEWEYHGALAARRLREANRRAILAVIDEFAELNKITTRELGEALDLQPRKRLSNIIEITKRRKKEERNEMESRRNARRELEKLKRATVTIEDGEEPAITPMRTLIAENTEHFCFICQFFHCGQHDTQSVYPVNPIRDPHQEIRLQELQRSETEPCKNECHMNQEEDHIPQTTEWSDAETSILNEYLSIFGKDPCYLAIVVGRSCSDIAGKISGETKETIALRKVSDEKLHRAKRQKARKRDIIVSEQKFEPCNHEGDCTVDSNCPCVNRGNPCEMTCGCKNVRFCEGRTGRGMARYVDRSSNMAGEHGLCSNLTPGCRCTDDRCDSDTCPCYKNARACNPDICEGCECNILGSKIPPSLRRCRNISPHFSWHKRTIIGRSNVHGYGLFAGDTFSKGELIGMYAGQLLDPRQVNIIDNLYGLKGRTFFFEMYRGEVVDAGLLGAKTKFVNGAKPEEEDFINCTSRLVRHRGVDRIALYASRDVEAGEEFRFDYGFEGKSLKQLDKAKEKAEPKPVKNKKESRKKRRTPRKTKTKT